MRDAEARTETVLFTDETLNDSRVTKSERPGKGELVPGSGRPGKLGTSGEL